MIETFGPSRVPLRVACCTLLSAVLTSACGGGGDGVTPPTQRDRTPIHIISGAGQTDTVAAVLPQALVVEIHDSTGQIRPGSTVRFTPLGPSNEPVHLAPSTNNGESFPTFASQVADAQGRARVLVALGPFAGAAQLEVAVPEIGAADTVTFMVKPGAPARLTLSPRDTIISPGDSYTLKAQTTDQYYNQIAPGVPTYSATDITVTSAGVVTGASVTDRAQITVELQGLSGAAVVSVVPKFPMVANRNLSVVLVNSDGTGAVTLATKYDYSLSPSSVPATPSVVYYTGDPATNGKVWVSRPNAAPRLLLPDATRPEAWPRLSPDGTWVYFVRDTHSIWRVHLDGSGLDSITSFYPWRVYTAPTISPDGESVAVEDSAGVQIYDLTTRTPRTVPVSCGFPRYSPDGAFFACQSYYAVSIMRTDGTGLRIVASFPDGIGDLSGVDWSPDGKWLFAPTTGMPLIDVSTGAMLSLARTGYGYYQASFIR